MLSVENLSCTRSDRLIFSGLGFSLQSGALLLLKGPNGIGKTTLLRMIAGLLPTEQGNITWNNESTKDNAAFKHDLMYVGHKSAVKADSTVEENLRFWAKIYNTELLIPAALTYFGLTKFKDAPASQLSAGWQRRVALARLIVAPCKLWLLDEPTNFLDEEAVILTASLIESRVTQGGIVIAASHTMSSAIASHTLWVGDFSSPAEWRGPVIGEYQTPQQVRG